MPFNSDNKIVQQLLWPVMALLLIVSWSSGFVGIGYANDHASVSLVLFWRTFISGLILLPFALLMGPRMTLKGIARQMVFGAMVVFLYLGGFSLAIAKGVPTGLVALISDLVPLAIAGLSQPLLNERLSGKQWLGTAIAIAGVVLVSWHSLAIGTAPVWAYGLTIGSMLVFALATVLQKSMGALSMPLHQTLSIQFLTGAMLFAIATAFDGGLSVPTEGAFWFGIAWLVLIATFLCYSIYYTSLRLYPASRVSATIYLSPPVTMIWAWALFNEPLTVTTFVGLGITMVGVWLTAAKG